MTERIRVRRVANGHDKTCPTCGQTLPEPKPLGLKMSPLRTRLFEIVRRAGVDGIRTEELIDMVYANHPDGGPLTAAACIRTHVFRINAEIRPKGFEIKGRHFGRTSRGSPSTGEYVYQRVQP